MLPEKKQGQQQESDVDLRQDDREWNRTNDKHELLLSADRAYETQKAVSFMEEGVKDVDNSLRLAEDASSENVQLHQAVESMFAIIQQLNKRSLDCGKTITKVDHCSTQMRQTVVVLQNSAETVRLNANKLQKLVGQFEVSS